MNLESLMLVALLLPLVGAAGISLAGSKPNLRETVTLTTAGVLAFTVWSLVPPVLAGARPRLEVTTLFDGLAITFQVEPLGMLFAALASSLWIVNSIYSIGYMRGNGEKHQTRFYIAFAVAIFAALGVAFAGNLLTLFIFYEILTISTYPLVSHKGDAATVRSARVYLGLLLATSIGLLLPAVIWTYVQAGTLDFTPGGILDGTGPLALGVLLACFAFGTAKAGLMPVHRWLPAAMVAPTPVSALLHAVAVVKAGVFTILKVVIYIFGVETLAESGAQQWLVWIASGTIVLASLIAMTKDNLKARLAYSTVSQLSYIVLGAALATASGVIGATMHIVTHAAGKITLFFCAGAIYTALHKTLVSELSGVGRTMPFTFAAFTIAALSIIGLPPFAGAWSKWFLVLGALEAGELLAVAVLMLSSLLNIIYLLQIPLLAFFREPAPGDEFRGVREAPLPSLLAIGITSLLCLVLFFAAEPLYQWARLLPSG
ncbi:monovalent cation/H+ antiporter subunit D family protein [Pseudohaliea rubra]|uniref:NADH-ubiquinone oxidoreductase chain L n=1 Tax=Pseudohaliea rubra DSM 19751 TaxID=1265313 RepID=A0A095VR19_9GAMM|nr:monovalent cation/H+ antiporter subunit D family protein [Pseudohaliea rubra]KGE03538.1 NADH-ubiquinone oxidoreductase chain L [Pseudohaliea rubra DSM 19751]